MTRIKFFSIVQRPQRSGGQTIPRAVSGDQSRGLAAEILFRPRGRGFFHSQSQNHSATLHQSTTTTSHSQHHSSSPPPSQHQSSTTTAPVHHHNNPQDKNHNQHLTPLFPDPPAPIVMFFCFVIFEVVMFISRLPIALHNQSLFRPFSAFPTFQL